MAKLAAMPALNLAPTLSAYVGSWQPKQSLSKQQAMALSAALAHNVGDAFAAMLGGIPLVKAVSGALRPPPKDCVEFGDISVVGAIRPQQFDVAYRPDGLRLVCDTKTLNSKKSVKANYLNMINDLAHEAATADQRSPHAVAAFVVAIPENCVGPHQLNILTTALSRLTGRVAPSAPADAAEAIALVLWDPATGAVNPLVPAQPSIRIDNFHTTIEATYALRYGGYAPH